MRLLLILLLPACLFAQTGSLRLLTGTWVSEHETDNVTQVIVRVDGARTIVHAWGACHPTDCDWGETDADLWNGIPVAIWKWGFATTRMQLILDRKSTRLNSSHLVISYAVFCLKKNAEKFVANQSLVHAQRLLSILLQDACIFINISFEYMDNIQSRVVGMFSIF